MRSELLTALWYVMALFLANEKSSGKFCAKLPPFQLSSQNKIVEPSPTETEVILLKLSKSLTMSLHQNDPLLF
jgi:hypothetical protein